MGVSAAGAHLVLFQARCVAVVSPVRVLPAVVDPLKAALVPEEAPGAEVCALQVCKRWFVKSKARAWWQTAH